MADEIVDSIIKEANDMAAARANPIIASEPKITTQGLKKKEIPISVRVDPEMLMKIDQYVEKKGGDRSKLIRNCVSQFFESVTYG